MDLAEPSDRDLEDARILQQDLVEIFTTPRASSDADRLDEANRICQMLRIAIEDQPCHSCLRQIERYSAEFFVTTDDVGWTWHTPTGYAKLHGVLLRLVKAVGLRLTYLNARRRSSEVSMHAAAAPSSIRSARHSPRL